MPQTSSKTFKKVVLCFTFLSYTLHTGSTAYARTTFQAEIDEGLKTYLHLVGEAPTDYNSIAIDEIKDFIQKLKSNDDQSALKPFYIDLLSLTEEHLKEISKLAENQELETLSLYHQFFLNSISYRKSVFTLLEKHKKTLPAQIRLSMAFKNLNFNRPLTQNEWTLIEDSLLPDLGSVIEEVFSSAESPTGLSFESSVSIPTPPLPLMESDGVFKTLFFELLNQVDLSKNNRSLSLFYLKKAVELYFTSPDPMKLLIKMVLIEKAAPFLLNQPTVNWNSLGFPNEDSFKDFKSIILELNTSNSELNKALRKEHADFFNVEFVDPLTASNSYSDFLATLAQLDSEYSQATAPDVLLDHASQLYDIMGDLLDSLQITHFFLIDDEDAEEFERLPDHQFLQKAIEQVVFVNTPTLIKHIYLKGIYDYVSITEMYDPLSVEAQRRLVILFDYGKEHGSKHHLKQVAYIALTSKTFDPIVRLSAFNYLNSSVQDPIEKSLINRWKKQIIENNPVTIRHSNRLSGDDGGFELIVLGESVQPDFIPLALAEGHHKPKTLSEKSGDSEKKSAVNESSLMCKDYL